MWLKRRAMLRQWSCYVKNKMAKIIVVTFNTYPHPFYKIVKTLRTYTRIRWIVCTIFHWNGITVLLSNWRAHQWLTNKYKEKIFFGQTDEIISVLICLNFFWWGPFATSSWNQTEHIQSKSKLPPLFYWNGIAKRKHCHLCTVWGERKNHRNYQRSAYSLALPDSMYSCELK